MKVLITGGSGFVGNNLARKLISQKNQVGLLLREGSKTWRIKDLEGKVDLLKGDLTNIDDLKKIIGEYKPEFIYHFGAYGNFPGFQKNVEKMISVNVGGIFNIIEAAKGIPIINFGSSSEYGLKKEAMKESDDCNPDNFYGKTKFLQTIYCEKKEIPTIRLFSVYGPWQEPTQLIPQIIKSKLKGEKLHLIDSVRDYIYIDDIINAIIKATEKYSEIKGEIINLGTGQQKSTKDVLNYLDGIDSKKLEIDWDFKEIQTEPKIWVANISKAKKILNWEPKINLEDGLKKTYDWFKERSQ